MPARSRLPKLLRHTAHSSPGAREGVASSCLLVALACSPPIDDSRSFSSLGTAGTQGAGISDVDFEMQPATTAPEDSASNEPSGGQDPTADPSSEEQDFNAPANQGNDNSGAASNGGDANGPVDPPSSEPEDGLDGEADQPGEDPANADDDVPVAPEDPQQGEPPQQEPPVEGPAEPEPPVQEPPQQEDPSQQEPSDPPPPLEADCPAPQLLCDDFEAAPLDAFPNSPQWLAELGGCGSHVTDGALASSGTRSLRADGTAYPECMVHADISGQSELFIRSFVRLGAPSTESGHHVSVLEVGTSENQDDPEFRVGFRADAPCNDPGLDVTVGGLSAGERTECSGFDLAANQFACFEVHYLRQGSSLTFDVRIDGQVVVPETTYEGLVGAWTAGDAFFKFGRASYGGNNAFSVWHDDVVVSTQPIGCN